MFPGRPGGVPFVRAGYVWLAGHAGYRCGMTESLEDLRDCGESFLGLTGVAIRPPAPMTSRTSALPS
jgi:hypothetical protein